MEKDISFTDGMLLYADADLEKWNLLKKLYNDNFIMAEPAGDLRIPKIIHQIWLGGSLPEEYLKLQESWKKHHPDWQFMLWTDDTAKDLSLKNREVFNNTKNLGAKSDILRYEILYQFGGLYADTDFECLRPFDDLHHTCDLYAGLLTHSNPRILIGLIGCSPNSDIMSHIIDQISLGSRKHSTDEIFQATGPLHFTRCFFETIERARERCVIFPASYFYPSPNSQNGKSIDVQKKYIRKESHAIHYWHLSWTKNRRNFFEKMKAFLKFITPFGIIALNSRRSRGDDD